MNTEGAINQFNAILRQAEASLVILPPGPAAQFWGMRLVAHAIVLGLTNLADAVRERGK